MKKFRVLTILIVLFLVACAPAYKVKTTRNDFDGFIRQGMDGNKIDTFWLTPVELNAVKVTEANTGLDDYFIEVVYNANVWLFIERGESLIFLIDGQRVGLSGDGSSGYRHVRYGGKVQEFAYYPVSRFLFEKLGMAQTVRVRLEGGKGYLEGSLTTENKARFAAFFDTYVAN